MPTEGGSQKEITAVRVSVSARSSSSAALREQMVTFIDKMRENGADTEAEIVERYMEAAEQEGVTLTRDEVMDELAADFAGDMLDDADLFAKFSKENRTAAQKLLDSLKEFLAKVKTAFTGKYRDMAAQEVYGKDFAELEDIAKQWQAAFEAAERQAEKTKTAAGKGDGARYMIRNVGGETMTVIDTENDTRDFKAAEAYLKTLADADHPFSTILADAQPVYVGKDLPGEYKSSEYTKTMKSALRKIKMQAATNLDEMLLLAENGEWRENVKPQFSLKAPVEAEKKGHVKSAKEFFGETNNWNETGYITTDGTKLDFSGRHEGAPGGQTGRRGDGRDRRGAV